MPVTPPNIYTSREYVEAIMGVCGVNLRINDSETTVISAVEESYLNYAIYVASATVDMYLSNRYAPALMLTNMTVINWATIMAAYRVAIRRCGSAPASLQWEYEQTMDMLKQVQDGTLPISNIPSLSSPGASLSNVRLDPRFPFKQLRVEGQLSDSTPTRAPVVKDIPGQFWIDRNGY